MNHSKSQALFQEAKTLIPGGVNSPARAFGAVGGSPIVMKKAQGPYIYDVDGNRYVDYVLSWGPMILGHQNPAVNAALEEAIRGGTSFGAPTEAENELARLVIDMVPSVEKVRLVNSGTEATMSAVRLARGYTGRNKIVKFIGCYHGHVDSLLVAAGSAAATFAVPNSPGVTPGAAADTVLIHYNDVAAVRETFDTIGDELACVIVEPVAGNMGCVPGTMEFLSALREETLRHGSLLIFDEVMSGFRVAAGGAQKRTGIMPDLTTLGKIIGGGLPVGAYGGRQEIMDYVIPAGKVYQAGTLSGNPLATAAGIATLKILQEQGNTLYESLERKTEKLARGLESAGRNEGIATTSQNCGAMMTLFFTDPNHTAIHSWNDATLCRTDLFAQFFWGMIERGFYWPCSQFESLFLSASHDDSLVDQTISAAAEVFRKMQSGRDMSCSS